MKKTQFDVGANAVVQLGENLYKNTYGVLIEYITNSYDADASFVKINIDRIKGIVTIEDDGVGMTLDELGDNFLKVGNNRRKKYITKTTNKGRLVTGRKGFGKLACFGLFKSFRVDTYKNNQLSSLIVTSKLNEDDEFEYEALIDEKSKSIKHANGTIIYLSENTSEIVDNESLAESIAKRLNIMYDGTPTDPTGFKIFLEDYEINQSYRNQLVLNHDIKFSYKIPEDINRFTKNKEIINYISMNKITGTIIAREKTVRIKENKGVVLFARGKLCQEATFLNINPSNSYGYAHLYAEFHVDFIDDEKKDNIGTDRTALNETPTTIELFKVIETLIKAYGSLYDDDAKNRDNQAIEDFKTDELYLDIKKGIETISNEEIRNELLRLLTVQIKYNIKDDSIDKTSFDKFQMITNNITPTYILNSEQISKDEPKDNIMTSYDFLMDYLRNKYNYTGNDGKNAIDNLYSSTSKHLKMTNLASCLPPQVKADLQNSSRELGQAIVNIRNSIMHTNNRICINENISVEDSKRFLIMIDLFIDLDKKFFEKI